MASFSSGVMISKSEAERRRGDEQRMRRHGLDPGKGEDFAWGGAVISRRQHKPVRTDKEAEKGKEELGSFLLDIPQVMNKRPESRLKWLQKALMLAAKGLVPIATIYDIVQNSKFLSGVSGRVGKQMRAMLAANLHLFNTKQQRGLQSEASKFNAFPEEASPGRSKSRRHADTDALGSGRHKERHRNSSPSSQDSHGTRKGHKHRTGHDSHHKSRGTPNSNSLDEPGRLRNGRGHRRGSSRSVSRRDSRNTSTSSSSSSVSRSRQAKRTRITVGSSGSNKSPGYDAANAGLRSVAAARSEHSAARDTDHDGCHGDAGLGRVVTEESAKASVDGGKDTKPSTSQLKISLQPWQPYCVRAAAAASQR